MEFGSNCEHCRKVGYICVGDRWLYPYVGDYMIKDSSGKISFMSASDFEATFELFTPKIDS
jgi:hypothetical protein